MLCPTLWTTQKGSQGLPHAEMPDEGGGLLNTYWVADGSSKAKAVCVSKRAPTQKPKVRICELCTLRSPEVHKLVLWTVPGSPGHSAAC